MARKALSDYPQMPPFTTEEIEAFLNQPRIARLGTLNEDGTIHLTPIYFKYENGEFILGTQERSRRVRNIKRNSNVTLLVDDTERPFQAVMIYGTATLDYEHVVDKRTAIFENYGTPLAQARAQAEGLCNRWESVIIHIKPAQLVSFDYSKASLP
jgi:hypothetical protein